MPFTASHTAIILPLLKQKKLSVSGLLMGSMVPDFEFFIRLQAHVIHGHSIDAMFWLNIPTAILCITLYHLVVRNQLILNLPLYFRKRFQPFLNFDWITYFKLNYIKVISSILIGNISHLLWDSFTHFDGFVVTKIAFLNAEFWQIPLYHIMQYGFSVLGAFAVWNFISKMTCYRPRGQFSWTKMLSYWSGVALITVLVYLLSYDVEDFENFGAQVVFVCAGFMIGLIITSIAFKILESSSVIVLLKRHQTKKL